MKNHRLQMNKLQAYGFSYNERACKPGSVLTTIYLGLPLPTGSSHLRGTAGPACVSPFHGVAPDRVYSVHVSPRDGWALTPPFHLHRSKLRQSISVALVRGSPLAGVTRYPCPVEPGLSSCMGFRAIPAVVQLALWCILSCFWGKSIFSYPLTFTVTHAIIIQTLHHKE